MPNNPHCIPTYLAIRFGAAVFIASAFIGYIIGGIAATFCALSSGAEIIQYIQTGHFTDYGLSAIYNFGYSLGLLLSSSLSHATGQLLLAIRDIAQNSFRSRGQEISN